MSALNLDERYAAIAEALPRQRAAYTEWVASDAVDGPVLMAAASAVGIRLDVAGGQGALAFEMANLNGISVTVVDPRPLDLKRLVYKWR